MTMIELPACEAEDSGSNGVDCYWDATARGNGQGNSFVHYKGAWQLIEVPPGQHIDQVWANDEYNGEIYTPQQMFTWTYRGEITPPETTTQVPPQPAEGLAVTGAPAEVTGLLLPAALLTVLVGVGIKALVRKRVKTPRA